MYYYFCTLYLHLSNSCLLSCSTVCSQGILSNTLQDKWQKRCQSVLFQNNTFNLHHVNIVVIQSTQFITIQENTGSLSLLEKWQPRTSLIYLVCWNATCFPSSDTSSIPRCPSPSHEAFWLVPGSTGTTWAQGKNTMSSVKQRINRTLKVGINKYMKENERNNSTAVWTLTTLGIPL